MTANREALAWWSLDQLDSNTAVRPEMLVTLPQIRDALAGSVQKVSGTLITDGHAIPASQVRDLMLKDFPPKALGWVKDSSWQQATVPLDRIDFTERGSWAAHHQPSKVDHFADKITDGDPVKPVILVDTPGDHDYMVVDGHHRALAYRKLNTPVVAYVGITTARVGPWNQTHSFQYSDAEKQDIEKSFWDPGKHPRDARGRFGFVSHGEFGAVGPTGLEHRLHERPNPDFTSLRTQPRGKYLSAARIGTPVLHHTETKNYLNELAKNHPEFFTKNTQLAVHDHKGEKRLVRLGTSLALASTLTGFMGAISPEEAGFTEIPDSGPSASEMYNHFHNIEDKDDPFYSHAPTAMTGSPPPPLPNSLEGLIQGPLTLKDDTAHTIMEYVDGSPFIRLDKDWTDMTPEQQDAFLEDLLSHEVDTDKSAETPELSSTHRPLGTQGLWGDKTEQLPAYIQNIAHALIRDGHDESSAISIAVGTVKRWATGGGKVKPEVRLAAAKAVAEWEELKARHSG